MRCQRLNLGQLHASQILSLLYYHSGPKDPLLGITILEHLAGGLVSTQADVDWASLGIYLSTIGRAKVPGPEQGQVVEAFSENLGV